MSVKIKVCGLKHKKNISSILENEIDFIGFIFYKNSKRYVLSENENISFLKQLRFKHKVGVFVNESEENIASFIDQYHLNYIQLHGDEDAQFCSKIALFIKVIKAFSIDKDFNFDSLNDYIPFVDFFLFDTKGKNYGGNGYPFDWTLLEKYKGSVPFFLSGGISPVDVEKIQKFNHHSFYGIDINSNFELEPSIKDEVLVKEFVKKIKNENSFL